ncbi:unnamed protein product [Tilletia caries]|uniref:Aromatic-L-amino-acid decarboxylase n=6 Tax=Tilletia TaxID=13289 RepID=A0ABN7J663_9BASI|nr:hypothetical protein CF336_g7427 [Tilletia laevis]KAE8197530.1 hypothetical protein CF328_g3818 [Tilletia controversa]CAD6886161.1 unnamed protein product [Tilletia caries]CAD6945540.1 unnamed protein product [Tilletia controversa]CAD6954770.1 unnamed protein product [Tilletia caries]
MLDIEGFRRAGYAAIDAICEYYARLDDLPVQAQVQPGFLMKQIPDSAPEEGEEWSAIDRDFHKIIMPGMTHWQSGMFAAYFPGNATFEGSLADLYASSVSNPGFNWSCSPSCTELELITVDWWAKVLGLDPAFQSNVPGSQGGGIIHGSASEVCITIAIAARERVLAELAKTIPPPTVNGSRSALPASANGMGCDIANELDVSRWRSDLTSRLVLYATTQTHSIAIKAASVLGLSFRALDVQAEDAYALRAHTLKAALDEDKEAGRIPFLLVLTVGTTSSGAVDNITEVVEVAREYPNMWLHIDAAYAGTALALPELRESSHLAAINAHADSFSTNAHKWGLIQLECSPLHVRDRGALTRALTVTPEFLRTKHGDAGDVLDLRNMQLSLGRRFRSLKLWFVLRSFGVKGLQDHLRHSIACAKLFEIAMRDDENPFEFVAPPRWSLVVFRLNPSRIKGQSLVLDDLNRRFMDRLNARSAELMLTQTVLPEIGVCIRYVVGQPGLREHHVIKAFKIVKECAEETLQAQ